MSTVAVTKERLILFAGPMVRTILEGRKTQTRRVVNPQPQGDGDIEECQTYPGEFFQWHQGDRQTSFLCPYGKPGGRLWVREACCLDWCDHIAYKADDPTGRAARNAGYSREPKWKPSIHMPRWASRIVLEITDVRVERLREISEADATAEGLESLAGGGLGAGPGFKWTGMGYHDGYSTNPPWGKTYHAPMDGICCCHIGQRDRHTPAVCAYRHLWDHINNKPGTRWKDNPWVWAIEFKRLIPSA